MVVQSLPDQLLRGLTVGVCLALFTPWGVRAERPDPGPVADAAARQTAWARHLELERASLFSGLTWRSVGPVVQSGRVVDLEAVPGEPYTFYVAYASGGLWRTRNNGVTFEPLFDEQPTLIMGDLALDPQNPQTLWVGTGENNSSRSSYGGWGVFRSPDAGKTWQHMGLAESDRIGRIVVDPRDGARVYVAALGKLYTPGGERGIYRTLDGGATWQQVLAGDAHTGFVDLALDPQHPEVLYAAAWERSRRPWNFVEGGAGSGIYKSVDGGSTWKRLAGGFPTGEHVGRIGLAISPQNPQTLYAVVDHQELLPEEQWDLGDGAITAKRLRKMTQAEFLAQDPEEVEDFIRSNDLDPSLDAAKLIAMIRKGELTLEKLIAKLDDANANLFATDIRGLELWRSDDGGETWRRTHDQPLRDVVYTYGYYFGQVRVAPQDPERVYLVGVPLITSADGGKTFTSISGRNVHVDYHPLWIDPAYPDRMIAGNDGGLDVTYDGGRTWLQLDEQPVGQFYTVAVDMAEPYNIYGGLQDNGVYKGSSRSRPLLDSWTRVGGGDGMYVQIDPRDSQTVYWGFQFGFYTRVNADGSRRPVRPREAILDPVLRYNWASPILLSSHNPDILYFGANRLFRSLDRGETWTAISPDLTRAEERGDVPFATLTTIAESPLAFGLLWVGTDDGLVYVNDQANGAASEWREVTAGLPRSRWVSRVEASHHDRNVAYLSLNGYRDDDITPYLYRSEDLGRTWTSIAAGLPSEPINVVREDPVRAEVLYVGTDRGVYVSLDRGLTWQGLSAGLPPVPVHDLVVHPRDRELVAGTHGRSVWVLDVLPVEELQKEVQDQPVKVFPLEAVKFDRGWRSRRSPWFYRPEDDPELKIPFWTASAGKAQLTIADADGRPLKKLELDAVRGVHTFTWDLLLDPALALPAEAARRAAASTAEAPPGKGKKKAKEPVSPPPEEGVRAQTPWAEAVRLERPVYITPGKYQVIVGTAAGEAQTELEIKEPDPREARSKKKMHRRGEKDE